jgi:hypothetical protein
MVGILVDRAWWLDGFKQIDVRHVQSGFCCQLQEQ